MSMAEVIKSLEREALREAQSHEIGGRNGKPIEASEFHDMTIDIDTNDGGYVKFDFNGKRYIYYNCFVESIADID